MCLISDSTDIYIPRYVCVYIYICIYTYIFIYPKLHVQYHVRQSIKFAGSAGLELEANGSNNGRGEVKELLKHCQRYLNIRRV